MKMRVLWLVIVTALVLPMSAVAIDADWSGSYEATGFTLGEDVTEFDADEGDWQGFYQSVRIAPTFDLGGDVKLHVGLRLYDQYWFGDHRKQEDGGGVTEWGQVGTDPQDADEDFVTERIGLDVGYVELPLFGGQLSVGRQEANWGHGLTTADDRRDRVAYQYDLDDVLGGPLSLLAIYDLRQSIGPDDISSDGHLFATAAVGYNLDTEILWGLLGGYWAGDATADPPFVLDSVALVGPFMEGPVGPVDLKFAAHTIFPVDNDRTPLLDINDDGEVGGLQTESGGLWNTFNFATMLRPSLDFSEVTDLQPQVLVVEAQGLFVFNGGLVEPGFDTYSSMIGNAGRNTVNPTNVFNMGGTGYEDDHQMLGAARVNYEIFPGLNAIVAGGVYHFFEYERDVDNSWAFGLDPGSVIAEDETVRAEITDFFVDVGLQYAVTEQATLFANYGWLGDDTSKMTYAAGAEEGDPRHQVSAGVEVSF